jgi:hypothetical protein
VSVTQGGVFFLLETLEAPLLIKSLLDERDILSSCWSPLVFLCFFFLFFSSNCKLSNGFTPYLFDVLALLMKLLPKPDFLLDLMSPGISSLAVDFGVLIDNAVKNLGFCFRKVLDATRFFDVNGKLLLQTRLQTVLAVSAADVRSCLDFCTLRQRTLNQELTGTWQWVVDLALMERPCFCWMGQQQYQ